LTITSSKKAKTEDIQSSPINKERKVSATNFNLLINTTPSNDVLFDSEINKNCADFFSDSLWNVDAERKSSFFKV
jgi:hypothetical protein